MERNGEGKERLERKRHGKKRKVGWEKKEMKNRENRRKEREK